MHEYSYGRIGAVPDNGGAISDDDGGPPITYAKVENFQRLKLDLEIEASSHHSKQNGNEVGVAGQGGDRTLRMGDSLFSDGDVSLTSQRQETARKPRVRA